MRKGSGREKAGKGGEYQEVKALKGQKRLNEKKYAFKAEFTFRLRKFFFSPVFLNPH
ncbi:MAG: hypothetical protein HZB61_10095 [Nitrospirae bacterium]|nr:hypothetical protein [Nitrospirota bacterium]